MYVFLKCWALHNVYCVLCAVYCVLCIVYCVLRTVYCVLCTVYCVLCGVNPGIPVYFLQNSIPGLEVTVPGLRIRFFG
jgi:hypothetical protein